ARVIAFQIVLELEFGELIFVGKHVIAIAPILQADVVGKIPNGLFRRSWRRHQPVPSGTAFSAGKVDFCGRNGPNCSYRDEYSNSSGQYDAKEMSSSFIFHSATL